MPRFYKITYSGVRHRVGLTRQQADEEAEITQRYSPPGDRVVVEVKPDRESEREHDEAYKDYRHTGGR